MEERPGWDEYWLGVAEAVARRSTCARRKVGAVAVDADNRILGTGYNGAVSGDAHCTDGGCPRGLKSYDEVPAFSDYGNCIAVHAEINALMSRTWGSDIHTMYITYQPCKTCRTRLRLLGVRIVHS